MSLETVGVIHVMLSLAAMVMMVVMATA